MDNRQRMSENQRAAWDAWEASTAAKMAEAVDALDRRWIRNLLIISVVSFPVALSIFGIRMNFSAASGILLMTLDVVSVFFAVIGTVSLLGLIVIKLDNVFSSR